MLCETNASNAFEVLTLLRLREADQVLWPYFAQAILNFPNFFTANILLYSNDTLCDEKMNYFLDFAITKCSSCNN